MSEQKKINSNRTNLIITIVVSLLILLIASIVFFNYYIKKIKTEKYKELSAIAQLKTFQLENWLSDRNGDIKVISESQTFNEFIQEYLTYPQSKKIKDVLFKQFLLIKEYHNYENILLLSTSGDILLSTDSNDYKIDNHSKNILHQIFKEKDIVFSDFYFCNTHKQIHLDIYAPLLNKNNALFAILCFRNNPSAFIYPLIQSWPGESKTSETLIVRKEGDKVLFLNDLKNNKNAALKLKIPLSRTNIPAVQAVNGISGMFTGKDYIGNKVLADLRTIKGTNWFLITKINFSELYSDFFVTATIILLSLIIIFIVIIFSFSNVYNQRQKIIYKQLFIKERNLRETQEEFKTILYSIGDAVITNDKNGKIKLMNKIAEELTGWKENEAKDKPLEEIFRIINEDSRQKVENPVQRVLKDGIIAGLANHTLLISKDGTETPITDSGAPIKNEKGQITGVVLVFRSQAEERIAQKILSDSQKRYHSLFLSTNDGVCLHEIIFDNKNEPVNYKILDVNPKYEEILGISKQAAVNKLATELYQTNEAPYLKEYYNVAKTGLPYSFETYFSPLNKYFKISVFSPAFNHFATVFQDITLSKLAFIEIKESEERLNALINATEDIICFKDDKRRWLIANDSIIELYQLKNIDYRNKTEFELAEYTADIYKEVFRNCYKTDESAWNKNALSQTIETIPDSKGNNKVFDIYKIPLFNTDGSRKGLVVFGRDITQRIKTEEELLKAKQKAEESDHLKTAFLHNISHEIRTPMNAIIGFSQFLKYDNLTPDKKENYINIIDDSCAQLLAVISDIINIASIEANQEKIKINQTDINKLLKKVYDQLSFRVKPKKINFTYKSELSAKEAIVMTDETKLSQILINLISNAIKFTFKGEICFGCQIENNLLKFYVKDTGIGIHQDY
ncbi:MAG: PAS domain S-box protein, partial [Bacteroidales bacterium]|nr:PAS domain S-box protein [Bacteroidales bacterium]